VVIPQAPRNAARHCRRQTGHRHQEGEPQGTRQRLQHRLPQEHTPECEQAEKVSGEVGCISEMKINCILFCISLNLHYLCRQIRENTL